MSNTKAAIRKVETERDILFDSLLFKLGTISEKEVTLMAIPETCADRIISLYHSSLFAGHQGLIKTYLITGAKLFIPGLKTALGQI